MSKDFNNNKVNINQELLKKQIFDSIAIFAAFAVIFYCISHLEQTPADMLFTLFLSFVVMAFALKYSTNVIKKQVDNIILSSLDSTLNNINIIHEKNKSQKDNHLSSINKIKDIISLFDNLQRRSYSMDELTKLTSDKTSKSLDFTNNEYNAVKTNIEKMFSIRHKIQTIAELILELSDFVQSISSTVGLVEDIAEQTNLLALNAAVEAARAGEHGKGFAVVASEIRKLADESKQATAKIISQINDIQQTANSTVLATEEGTKEIESGLEHAHLISENIEQLINAIEEISTNMQEIIVSSRQINKDSKTADLFIKEISKIVETNKEITSENDTIFEKIESNSQDLKQLVI